jgi:hypothetical protein
MTMGRKSLAASTASAGLLALALLARAAALPQGGDERPRPGLTAQQAKQAIELAKDAMRELRKNTDGATEPSADQREYVVGVELLARKDPQSKVKAGSPKGKAAPKPEALQAVVTAYRYFDDITVYATVDLKTGRVVDVQALRHMRTPLSDAEFEEAVAFARARSSEVKKLYERYGDQLTVYPQFSQYTTKDDPRVHRVVHLTYRVDKHDLSYPRPQIDLTTRQVETPAPEPPDAGRTPE